MSLAVAAKVEERVRGLSGDHVVEREDLAHQIVEHREDVVGLTGHDPEAQLVVDGSGDRLLLRQELRVERILVLAAADEFQDGKALCQHRADHPVDLLLDQVKDLLVGHREHEEELAGLEVMDDVHHLQDGAGAELPVAPAGGEHEQRLDVGVRHRLRDGEVEVALEVADRGVLHRLGARDVRRVRRGVLLGAQKRLRRAPVLEVQAMPVDDRAAAQQKTDRLEVGQRELIERLVAGRRRRQRRGRHRRRAL